jgi:hypothetical protein
VDFDAIMSVDDGIKGDLDATFLIPQFQPFQNGGRSNFSIKPCSAVGYNKHAWIM